MAKLGDVSEILRGVTFKPAQLVERGTTGAVACLRTKNVQRSLDVSDVLYVPASVIKQDRQYVRENDILISSANSWNLVGKCAWVGSVSEPTTFGGFISNLRANTEKVDARYLYWWFSSDWVQRMVRSFGQQTTNISNLNVERTLALDVPLPSLPEQRRLAAILDQVDDLRGTRRQSIEVLRGLTARVFHRWFGEELVEADASKTLGDVAEVASGITKGRKTTLPTRSIPYLTVANVQDQSLRLDVVKSIDATEYEIARFRLQEDDLLLTEGGDPDKLGRGALWHSELPETIHQNHVFRVRVTDSKRAHPVFLTWLVGSPYGKSYFLRVAKQTTGIASVNSTQLKAFPLILPSIKRQTAFADAVAKLDAASAIHHRHLTKLDELFASLQDRAFRGEL